MKYNIALIPGDGIGPEVTNGAVLALEKVCEKFGHDFGFETALAGGCAMEGRRKHKNRPPAFKRLGY